MFGVDIKGDNKPLNTSAKSPENNNYSVSNSLFS